MENKIKNIKLVRDIKVVNSFWAGNIKALFYQRNVYDLQNLLNVQGRSVVGISKEDFINEAIYYIFTLKKNGYLKNIKEAELFSAWGCQEKNIKFEFTKKFSKEINKIARKNKIKLYLKKIAEVIMFVAAILAAIFSILSYYK